MRFSDPLHFQWLVAIENDGTSLYRSTGCRKTEFFNSLLGIFAYRYRQDGLLCMSLLGRGDVVTQQSGSHSRTITGYLAHLLEYPRWLMECDVDFTQCPYHGRYDNFVAECDTCIYGKACKWLSSYTTSAIKKAPLTISLTHWKALSTMLPAASRQNTRQTASVTAASGCERRGSFFAPSPNRT